MPQLVLILILITQVLSLVVNHLLQDALDNFLLLAKHCGLVFLVALAHVFVGRLYLVFLLIDHVTQSAQMEIGLINGCSQEDFVCDWVL